MGVLTQQEGNVMIDLKNGEKTTAALKKQLYVISSG